MNAHNPADFICANCQTELAHDGYYKVDRVDNRFFCSEECILGFYNHLIFNFEEELKHFKKELHLKKSEENFFDQQKDYDFYLGEVIDHPDEVFVDTESFDEEIVFVHKKFHTKDQFFFGIVIGIYFEEAMSFVLLGLFTSKLQLSAKYRRGKKLDLVFWKEREAKQKKIPEEFEGVDEKMRPIIQKKREVLWREFDKRHQSFDIPKEQFPSYEKFIDETLSSADEIFSFFEEKGQYRLFSKAVWSKETKESFFFVVLCMVFNEMCIPLIYFPTIDKQLGHFFRRGERIHGPTYS